MKRVIAVIWKQFPTRCITVILHIALEYDFLTFHHSLQQSSLAARQQSVRTCKSLQHAAAIPDNSQHIFQVLQHAAARSSPLATFTV